MTRVSFLLYELVIAELLLCACELSLCLVKYCSFSDELLFVCLTLDTDLLGHASLAVLECADGEIDSVYVKEYHTNYVSNGGGH